MRVALCLTAALLGGSITGGLASALALEAPSAARSPAKAPVAPKQQAIDAMRATDLGVRCDGISDDSASLQSAFEAAAGKQLTLPSGVCRVSRELTISQAVNVVGAGRGVTIIQAGSIGSGNAILKVIADNFAVRDLTLRGPSVAKYVGEEYGLRLFGTPGSPRTNARVTNVEVHDIGAYGIAAEYYHKVTVSGSYVHDVGYGGIVSFSANDFVVRENVIKNILPGTVGNAYGIFASSRKGEANPARFVFESNTVDNVPNWEGIDTHGGVDGVIANNVITNCAIGINVSPSVSGIAPHRVSVTGNVIKRGSAPRLHRGIGSGGFSDTELATALVVKGNTVHDMGWDSVNDGAIMFQFTRGLIISDNTVVNPRASGIAVLQGNQDILVSGNTVTGMAGRKPTDAGILVRSARQSGRIQGNKIDAGTSIGLSITTQNDGLHFELNSIQTTGVPVRGAAFAGKASSWTPSDILR